MMWRALNTKSRRAGVERAVHRQDAAVIETAALHVDIGGHGARRRGLYGAWTGLKVYLPVGTRTPCGVESACISKSTQSIDQKEEIAFLRHHIGHAP